MPETPDRPDQTQALQEYGDKFAPGEATAVDGQPDEKWGSKRERIPEKYQQIFRDLCGKIAMRDMFARIEESKKAAERRFAWRGMLDIVWAEDQGTWAQMGSPSGPQLKEQDTGDTSLHYPLNIFQAFGRGFITIVSTVPGVKMEATEVNAPDALRIASAAETLKNKIESQNDVDELAEDVARLMWTDGRVAFYTRWVTDGARFGYEDQKHSDEDTEGVGEAQEPPEKQPRQARGGEVITPYGVLEVKVPINMRRQSEFPYVQLAYEIDSTTAKAIYPDVGKKLQGGAPGPGELGFDRITRIACTQGIQMLTQAGDSIAQLPTYQRTWMRPAMFAEIDKDEDRMWFEDNYPDGAFIAFVGDTYCESRNESMDDHWEFARPLPGDGQATPSAGEIIMPVQYALCDMTDLAMESFMKAIPAIWCDKGMVDLEAIAKQTAGPGAHYPSKQDLEAGKKMQDAFWPEPTPELPASFDPMYQALFGDIPQFLTGLFPAAMGQGDASNETLGGIQQLSQASKGQAGVAWRAFRKSYAKSMTQAVRVGAYFRAGDADEQGILRLDNEEIELQDLREGNWKCKPDGDESYPVTHAERQTACAQFVQFAMQTPQGQQVLFEPKNLSLIKDVNGLPDLEIPGASAGEKQLGEIEELLQEMPIPIPEVAIQYKMATAMAAMTGQQPPSPPGPEQLYRSSIQIDPIMDDHQSEFTEGRTWVNSRKGQQAKREKQEGFLNVRLHLLEHKKMIDQAQQAQMQAQVGMMQAEEQAKAAAKPQKDPSESINYKDLGPSGRIQLAKRAGLDVTADEGSTLAGEAMGEHHETNKSAGKSPSGAPAKVQ
jgi:hypothetical protein